MNAPASLAHLREPQVEHLPLTAIALSETAMQAKRRGVYNEAALDELAKSIGENGLMHPVVVRKLSALRGLASYELVAGERRYLATQKLGQEHILARIVEITDAQVIKLQMVENLHREQLDTLAEAEGFKELLAGGLKAEELGDSIGKSRSYVYARLKLLDLSPAVQEALRAGTVDASKALLVARLPGEKLQQKALKAVSKTNWRGEAQSFRDAFVTLKQKFTQPLDEAPFSLAEEGMPVTLDKVMQRAPACLTCPHYSGNDPELTRELGEQGSAHICTQPACYVAKLETHWARRRQEAERDGLKIIEGEEARQICTRWGGLNGYVGLDEEIDFLLDTEDDDQQDKPAPTWGALLGEHCPPASVAIVNPHEKGELIEAITAAEARRAIKAAQLKLDRFHLPKDFDPEDAEEEQAPATPDPQAQAREKARREREEQRIEQERTFRRALLQQVVAKWKGPLKRDDLYEIADRLLDQWEAKAIGEQFYGGKTPNVGGMSEAELVKLLIIVTASDEADQTHGKPGRLLALAKRVGIDAAKLKKALEPKPEKPNPTTKSKR